MNYLKESGQPMLFNSIDFALFLPVVFLIYWLVGNGDRLKQNIITVAASYLFYGWWDWRFLSLLIFSTLLDYLVGIGLSKTEERRPRKWLLLTSIILNISLLGVFKYFNFFIENFALAFSLFGIQIPVSPLNIILPVGISFYTFQTISYSIDVYNRKIEPTRDLIAFLSYVSFFPQLVAGPIERATSLLPQFYKARTFDYENAVDGMRQILWGMFKKVVIADSCGAYVDMAFGDPNGHSAGTLMIAVLLFPLQVYGDFSGYSDIAIGTARLFGINLNRNFAFPFFSLSVAEFWRRWHISLYTWFRDYIFLHQVFKAKNRGTWTLIKANFLISVLIGFWHGAGWNFIIWGLLNGVYLSVPMIIRRKRMRMEFVPTAQLLPTLPQFIRMNGVYLLIALAALFFRVDSLAASGVYMNKLVASDLFVVSTPTECSLSLMLTFFILTEWFGRGGEYAIQFTGSIRYTLVRYVWYLFILFFTGMYMQSYENPFIYFNF